MTPLFRCQLLLQKNTGMSETVLGASVCLAGSFPLRVHNKHGSGTGPNSVSAGFSGVLDMASSQSGENWDRSSKSVTVL